MSNLLEELDKRFNTRTELSSRVGKSYSAISTAIKNEETANGIALNLALKLKENMKLESIENGRIITVEITYKK